MDGEDRLIEITGILEQAIAALPDSYRAVFMLREVEEMSTDEAAEALDLTEENVRPGAPQEISDRKGRPCGAPCISVPSTPLGQGCGKYL